MRPIDADYLDEFIAQLNREGRCITRYEYKMFDNILFEFPTIDAVPVVRCKDCKHNSLKRMTGNAFCELGIGLSQIYDFCSRGERRETDATLH